MSKPKESGWGYAKSMVKRYPQRVNQNEKEAVEKAISATLAMPSGDIRMKVVELVLMKQTHTIQGAALKCYCSEKTAYNYHWDFIREVGKNFHCEGLW